MFGLFKKDDSKLLADVSQRLFMLETANEDGHKMVRTLYKAMDEAERVQARMAKTIADHEERIRVLTEQLAEHCEALEVQGEFNDFVATIGMDGSEQMKKHQCQLAALFSWREKAIDDLATLKGRT